MSPLRKLRHVFAVILISSVIWGQEINAIDQTITVDTDGSAQVQLILDITVGDSISSLNIPAEYSEIYPSLITLNGNATGIETRIVLDRTSPVYEILFSAPVSGVHQIVINSEIPEFLDWEVAGPEEFKTYNWEVTYSNTLPTVMDRSTLTVILPQGWNYHRINGSDPKFKKKEPKPPYTFAIVDGRASVSISRALMGYMQSLAIDFAFKNEHKPNILIYVGVLLSMLYLYYFRHLVQKKEIKKTNDSNESTKEK